MATTSQGISPPRHTGAHESTNAANSPSGTPEDQLRATLITLLRPAMTRMDKLGETQIEMMRMQRELMGVVLSMTLRLDEVAGRGVDNRRPDSSNQNNGGDANKTANDQENFESRQRCHCGVSDTLKESISRGVAEAKAEILNSISALSDHFDAGSKEIEELLKLHYPPSPILSQQNLDSRVVTTDTNPTSGKRRRVDFEREDVVMDGTDPDQRACIGPWRVPAEQSKDLERVKDPVVNSPPAKNTNKLASSPSTVETNITSCSNVNTLLPTADPFTEAESSFPSNINTNSASDSHSATINRETEHTPNNTENGSFLNPIDLTCYDASSRPTTPDSTHQHPMTTPRISQDLIQQHRSGFLHRLAAFMESRGTPLPPSLTGIQVPSYNPMNTVWTFVEPSENVGHVKLAGRDVDIFLLWAIVFGNGGANAVTSSGSWARILPHFNLPEHFSDSAQENGSTSTAFTLSRYYYSILYPFELLYRRTQAQQRETQRQH